MPEQTKRNRLSTKAETDAKDARAWKIVTPITSSKEDVNELVVSLQHWRGDGQASETSLLSVKDFWSQCGNDSSQIASLLRVLLQKAPSEAVKAPHDPMRSLPDLPNELLNRILLGQSTDTTLSISRVCRRLRQLAMSNPQYWRHVSNYQRPTELKLFLTCSKKEMLSLSLYAKTGDKSSCTSFLRAVYPHRKRWKEFRFESDDFRRDFFRELLELGNDKPVLHLPALETLHLQCYRPEKYERDAMWNGWVDIYFWGRWKMPKLRTLSISSVPEECPHPHASVASLTSLRIDYRRILMKSEDLTNHADFISEFQALKHLELTFYKLKRDGFNSGRFTEMTLPNLEHFHLHFTADAFQYISTGLSLFGEVMEAISTPRLLTLVLQVDSAFTRNILGWLRCIKYDTIKNIRQIYLRFRAPDFGVLFQFPHKNKGNKAAPAPLVDIEGNALIGVPAVKLSTNPATNTNLVRHLFEDRKAREYLKDFKWFREDGPEGDSLSCDSDYITEGADHFFD